MPRATIVVPAFNVAATLGKTLDSLRCQSFEDLEIVVVDDGSRDATPELVHAASVEDTRIQLVQQSNRGLAGARNSGIAAARGSYVGFCDADDLWEPGKLAAHVAHLDADPSIGLSFSGSALIDETGNLLRSRQAPRLEGIDAAHIFKRNPVGNGSALVMRRAALRTLSWRPNHEPARDWVFDESFRQSEDIECWLRLALTTNWKIAGIPGFLTRYRITGGGLSAATDRQLQAWERMVEKLTPLAPAFFARHAPSARAYQLRYLARRAISDGKGTEARRLMRAALTASPRPIWEEPAKSLSTILAAGLIECTVGRRVFARGLRRVTHP